MITSIHSPKNKYSVEINYLKPLKGIGSVASFTINDITNIDSFIKDGWMNNEKEVHVIIRENKASYPDFDWHVVANYHLAK